MLEKHVKTERSEFAEMRHGDVILTFQCRHGLTCDQRVADVRVFAFHLSHGLVWVCEINKIHRGVQWGQKYPNLRANSSSEKRGLSSFPLGLGFYLEPLNSNDYFSHIPFSDALYNIC